LLQSIEDLTLAVRVVKKKDNEEILGFRTGHLHACNLFLNTNIKISGKHISTKCKIKGYIKRS